MSTSVAKSKEAFHERDASFSSSIQSNDSVFTDTDGPSSIQTSSRSLPGEIVGQNSSRMDSTYSKDRSNRSHIRKYASTSTSKSSSLLPGHQQLGGEDVQLYMQKGKPSPKDSGYGSRLDTDELQSPLSDKSSPGRLTSHTKRSNTGSTSVGALCDIEGQSLLPIVPLARSPVLVNRSYLQFYYLDDPIDSFASLNETPFHDKLTMGRRERGPPPSRKPYPNRPTTLPEQPESLHNKKLLNSLQPIRSASCSSLDRLSLTSSLKEYASNLEKVDMTTSTDQEPERKRERLLSVTHFQTFSSDLESPQCATVVKLTSRQEESNRRKHLLSRFHIRKRKAKSQITESSHSSKEVVMTSAGEAQLRKKKRGKQESQRRVVSDDLTLRVHFSTTIKECEQTATASNLGEHSSRLTKKKHDHKEQVKHPKQKRHSQGDQNINDLSNFSYPRAHLRDSHVSSMVPELSQSTDGLADLQHLSMQLRKLAQPAQSTTNLDLSQRASETMSTIGLRVSHSVDDLSDPLAAPLSQNTPAESDEPREGFLWRVLGRASQRWPASIYIVPIQNSEAGIKGLCVRKGQQVRALYRVSGQVIVEMETNHLACIPYSCCRISRKYYGVNSTLVQLSYSQLYIPVPDAPGIVCNQSPLHSMLTSAASPGKAHHGHIPIEMVAIQDCYDCKPLGELNVDAGDKLRALYCDEEMVYAVKENGEAGLLTRSYCRLTRKSEKMFQKWVELTYSPFQADFPIKLKQKPPRFLTNGTLTHEKGDTSPMQKKCTVVATMKKAQQNDQNSTVRNPSDHAPSSSRSKFHKPSPPTPPPKRKRSTPASPLALNDHKSTSTAPERASDKYSAVTGSSISRAPKKEMITESKGRTLPIGNQIHSKPISYSGKLMTVVQNYVPQKSNVDYTIRKGLRVRVLHSSPDGKTLRVVTKTGSQFDIPASHLCFSRKNSEPLSYMQHIENTNDANSDALATNQIPRTKDHVFTGKPPSPTTKLPLEHGKIMTVIHDYVPTPENPMVTIRRGLRVKVLSDREDWIEVMTKTGNTFCIPRSHLRLSHKISDSSTFAGTVYQPKSPLTKMRPDITSHQEVNPFQRTKNSALEQSGVHSSPTAVCKHLPSGMQRLSKRGGNEAFPSTSRASGGCRISSSVNQVFELC